MDEHVIEFVVHGDPRPKGSMRAIMPKNGRYPIMIEDNKHSKPWMTRVNAIAQDNSPPVPWSGPVRVELIFGIGRSKSHYGTGRNAEILKDSAPEYPAKKPDPDKLARNILDSLTGCVYCDDQQVVELLVRKVWSAVPGVKVTAIQLSQEACYPKPAPVGQSDEF